MDASNGNTSAAAIALAHEFVMTRVFDAPVSLVFEAWTSPRHLTQWWGRKTFTMPFCEMDVRSGGSFRLCMRSPAGRDYWVKGNYLEVVEPERIVFRYALENEELNHDALMTVTFAEHQGKTTLTLEQALYDVARARDGAQGGWIDGLERLAEHLGRMA